MDQDTKMQGRSATPYAAGVAFRVWAPHAQRVAVIGTFNDWDGDKHPLQAEENGDWHANVAEVRVGDAYKFLLTTAQGEFQRIDPYARAVTNSVGNAIVHDTNFDWAGDDLQVAPWNELVIYELHVGTFDVESDNTPGKFATVAARLEHLRELGVNATQVMPVAGFAGERSWGYNPSHIFSVETDYGGPVAFQQFIKRAHQQGRAVILDVVCSHFGPGDLDLWQFDGWAENGRGGIYFYNGDRANTPWGETRPDYGRGEVRQYILFMQAQQAATAQYSQLASTGQTTTHVAEAVLAAHHGRVEILFVAVGIPVWGDFDPATNAIHIHQEAEPCDGDLLDLAAIQSILNEGTVYAVAPEKVPGGTPVAAVLGY